MPATKCRKVEPAQLISLGSTPMGWAPQQPMVHFYLWRNDQQLPTISKAATNRVGTSCANLALSYADDSCHC